MLPPVSLSCWAWILKGWPSKRLALALDATSLGDRFTVLSISVVYRGSACPVAWKIVHANVRHAWKPEWITLLLLVPNSGSRRLDRDRHERPWVVCPLAVSGDRRSGLASLDANHSQKQVPQERIAVESSGHSIRLEDRAAMARTWCGLPEDGSATARLHALGLLGIRSRRTMVRSDRLGPDQSDSLWYGMRAWIEQGFKLLKHGGWQWQMTRMIDPDRASRLWLVLAVATHYVLAVGGEADAGDIEIETLPVLPPASQTTRGAERTTGQSVQTQRPIAAPVVQAREPKKRASGTRQRLVSVFRQGLAALVSILIAGHALPKPRWKPEPWLEIRVNVGTCYDQPPTPVPKNPSL